MPNPKPFTLTLQNFEAEYEGLLMLAIKHGKTFLNSEDYFKEAYDYAQNILVDLYLKLVNGDKITKDPIANKEAFVRILVRNAFLNDLKKIQRNVSLDNLVNQMSDDDLDADDNITSGPANNSETTVADGNLGDVLYDIPEIANNELQEKSSTFDIKNTYRVRDLFNRNQPLGKLFSGFLQNEKQFGVLQHEFLSDKTRYKNIEEAIQKEPALAGLSRDNYDQLKLRGIQKMKVFFIKHAPRFLGGLAVINKKLPELWHRYPDEVLTPEECRLAAKLILLVQAKEKLPSPAGVLYRFDTPGPVTAEERQAYKILVKAVLKEEYYDKNEKDDFKHLEKKLDAKLLDDDLQLFTNVVLHQQAVPHGMNERFTFLCEKLIVHFSIDEFL